MMGERTVAQDALFYSFNLERHVPPDYLLRLIDRFVDLSDIREHLRPFYSETGRPSIDPELMIRMLIVGYCMGIRSERRLCEEVHLNLAYRWFCRLGLDGAVPDHSTFSKNRHGRFRDSDLLRELFEMTVARCMAEGLVGGEGFAVDASLIRADVHRQRSVPGEQGLPPEAVGRAVREYLDVLDDAAFGSATPVTPKRINLTDPASRWTAHCFTCTMRSHAAIRVTTALATHGMATLRFDLTGLGGSGGDFATAGFAADVRDIVTAADHLRQTVGAPSILIGHSLGGAAVLAAAPMISDARAVVTLGAPFEVAHALHRLDGDLAAIRRTGAGEVRIGGRPYALSADFLEALDRPDDAAARIAALGKALLVLHAPSDATVSIENARRIYDAARHPKSFVTLESADHLLTDARDAAFVAGLIAAWVERYLPDAA